MSEENKDKRDMLEAMKKALEEGKLQFPPPDNFLYFMNTKDRRRYDEKVSLPKNDSDAVFGIDPGIVSSDFIPEGKVYKVAKSMLFDARKPIDPPAFDHSQFESVFSNLLTRSFGLPSRLFGDKRKKINPNWSMEWDEWRNTGKYQWEWMNRLGDWLNKQAARLRR